MTVPYGRIGSSYAQEEKQTLLTSHFRAGLVRTRYMPCCLGTCQPYNARRRGGQLHKAYVECFTLAPIMAACSTLSSVHHPLPPLSPSQ